MGIIIGEYFAQQKFSETSQGAYDRIKKLVDHPATPDKVKDVAGHFLVRVNTEHNLPLDADLIAEAQWLKNHLLEQENYFMENNYQAIQVLQDEIEQIPSDSIVSKTIQNNEHIKSVIFGFASGQELSEHTAAVPAIIHVLQGEFQIQLGDDQLGAQPGSYIYMDPKLPHSIKAKQPSIMLLILIKQKPSTSRD